MNLFLTSLGVLVAASFLMLLSARSKKICGYLFLSSLIISCLTGLLSVFNILRLNVPVDFRAPWYFPFGEFYIGIDSLSALFLLLFFILALAAGIYGYG